MSCNFYADLRNKLFRKAQSSHDMFLGWSMDDRFKYLKLHNCFAYFNQKMNPWRMVFYFFILLLRLLSY